MALRATGVAEASSLIGEEADAQTLLELGMTAREINWRMRNLARNLQLRTDLMGKNGAALDRLAPLVSILDGA